MREQKSRSVNLVSHFAWRSSAAKILLKTWHKSERGLFYAKQSNAQKVDILCLLDSSFSSFLHTDFCSLLGKTTKSRTGDPNWKQTCSSTPPRTLIVCFSACCARGSPPTNAVITPPLKWRKKRYKQLSEEELRALNGHTHLAEGLAMIRWIAAQGKGPKKGRNDVSRAE